MTPKKINLSTGISLVFRQATMKDHKLASKEARLDSIGQAVAPDDIIQKMLGYIIIKAFDKEGKEIELGLPPVNFDKFLSLQEWFELQKALDDTNIIVDLKKKATVEDYIPQGSSPQLTKT